MALVENGFYKLPDGRWVRASYVSYCGRTLVPDDFTDPTRRSLNKIKIIRVTSYDHHFYRIGSYVDDDSDPNFLDREYEILPKMSLEEFKDRLKDRVKDDAATILADERLLAYAIRKAITGQNVPAAYVTYYTDVEAMLSTILSEINAFDGTVGKGYDDLVTYALAGWQDRWPTAP